MSMEVATAVGGSLAESRMVYSNRRLTLDSCSALFICASESLITSPQDGSALLNERSITTPSLITGVLLGPGPGQPRGSDTESAARSGYGRGLPMADLLTGEA